MDFNHNQTQQNRVNQSEPIIPVGSSRKKRSFKPAKNGLVGGLLALIVIILIVFGLLWFFRGNGNDEASQINHDEYQAVFLSNGQVYFGKLKDLNSTYAKLTDIYYLQVKQAVQPKQGDTNQSNNVQLVKLGQELHGPEDAMQINRDQVVFWENLKKSGKVTQAIIQYQKNGTNANSTSAPASSAPATSGNSSTTSQSTSSSDQSTTGPSTNDNSASSPTTTPAVKP